MPASASSPTSSGRTSRRTRSTRAPIPLATALARPLIAQLLVEVATREGADAVAHGCTGKGNDQVRFDVADHALDPGLEVIAPMRVGMGLTRDQEIDYANERGIEIPITKAVAVLDRRQPVGPLVRDRRPRGPVGHAAARRLRVDGRGRSDAPDPVEIVIEFEGGIPVALDGERLAPVELVERLHALGGDHGVGRIDHVEDRLVGIKSREIYETPAATILHTAHRALEGLTLSKDTLRFNRLRRRRAGPAHLRRPVVQRPVARPARLRRVVAARRLGRGPDPARPRAAPSSPAGKSPLSLYDKSLATYDEGDAFDHARAVGFIEIFGLPLRVEAARHGAVGKRHGAAWTWTDPLLEALPTTVTDPEPAAV